MPWTSFRYSLYAPIYDLLAWPLSGARRRAVTQAAIGPDDHVLIVGCGTGLDLKHIPRGCRVTATDLSVRMLASMRRRARAFGRDVSVHRMNAEDLDFPDDVVLSDDRPHEACGLAEDVVAGGVAVAVVVMLEVVDVEDQQGHL